MIASPYPKSLEPDVRLRRQVEGGANSFVLFVCDALLDGELYPRIWSPNFVIWKLFFEFKKLIQWHANNDDTDRICAEFRQNHQFKIKCVHASRSQIIGNLTIHTRAANNIIWPDSDSSSRIRRASSDVPS
jgi:hypothetical protein